jgi:hypothetical protein
MIQNDVHFAIEHKKYMSNLKITWVGSQWALLDQPLAIRLQFIKLWMDTLHPSCLIGIPQCPSIYQKIFLVIKDIFL